MNHEQTEFKTEDFIRQLCKDKSEAEIRAAEETMHRYLLLVKRICLRIETAENGIIDTVP